MTSKTQNVREQRKEMEIIQDCLNLNDYLFETGRYRLAYINPMVITNQKPTIDTQKLERKIYKRKSANHKGQD